MNRKNQKANRSNQDQNDYKIIFDNSLDALIIVDVETRIILEINQSTTDILGYQREDLIGKSFTILTSDFPNEKSMQDIHIYNNVFIQEFQCADDIPRPMDLTITMIPWKKKTAFLITVRNASERIRKEEEREKLIHKLEDAMDRIKKLRGLLPICAHCKKVRDDHGYWQQVEVYIRDHSQLQFSHGICPECMKKHYPDYYNKLKDENQEPH